MAAPRRDLGRVFEEDPELYDRVRPGYPDALLDDLVALGRLGPASAVLEVGSGTGQATRSLAARVGTVTAVEPGAPMVAVARRRSAGAANVAFEVTTFERWAPRGRLFDAVVAASSWHWVDPAIGWRRAHDVLRPGGVLAVLEHVVVTRPGEPEVYAATADLHERFSPGNPGWGRPPTEQEVRATSGGWGASADPGPWFERPEVRWYPTALTFDGPGFADHLRSTSLYRGLPEDVREALLAAVADRIRTAMGNRARRDYLTALRIARRRDPA